MRDLPKKKDEEEHEPEPLDAASRRRPPEQRGDRARHRADGKSGRVLFRFPHGEYVPVSGSGKRLLLHGYSRLYAVEAA